jgi:hypothetical protein
MVQLAYAQSACRAARQMHSDGFQSSLPLRVYHQIVFDYLANVPATNKKGKALTQHRVQYSCQLGAGSWLNKGNC